MHIQYQKFLAECEAFGNQLVLLNDVIGVYAKNTRAIPAEVNIELQHMLSHLLALANCQINDYKTKINELNLALRHLDRAFQDACKIIVRHNFHTLKYNIDFLREWHYIRAQEYKKHYRDVSSIPTPDSSGKNNEISNHICIKMYSLLKKYGLTCDHKPASYTIKQYLGASVWEKFVKEMRDWFAADAFYTSMTAEKNYESLNILIQCFWVLNVKRLQAFNLQNKLDIVLKFAVRAHNLGWNADILKRHSRDIRHYRILMQTKWKEYDLDDHSVWINKAYNDIYNFFSVKQMYR